MRATEIPNFDRLSDLERLILAEEILGSLRAPETLPAPLVHRLELDRRWAAYEANPANVLTKDEFRAKISAHRQ
jgi:putative addiction module component (TIGR02574 family)